MSFTLEGRGEYYVKLSMRWCRDWVRMKRVASLSSRYNSSKTQPFGIHFDIGFCRPIPSNVNASGIASKHQESYLYMRSKTVAVL
jgi:hypothetical protein